MEWLLGTSTGGTPAPPDRDASSTRHASLRTWPWLQLALQGMRGFLIPQWIWKRMVSTVLPQGVSGKRVEIAGSWQPLVFYYECCGNNDQALRLYIGMVNEIEV